MSKLLSGGRLASTRKDVTEFISSIKSDKKLLGAVIQINKAHVAMMMEQKIVDWQTGAKLLQALSGAESEIKLEPWLEDVHMAVEEEISKKAGPEVGGNIHIGKSRNDQVSTAIRMILRKELMNVVSSAVGLQEVLIKLAEKHTEIVVPGYTHLRAAQPVTFAHYLLSHVDALERDIHRLEENYPRVNLCPMGAGALATSSFPIDRGRVADLLGFGGVLENSIDAVGSRDFVLETLANLTILAINMSRFAEDLIVWSTPDFGVIELTESFSSTSSMMPQKKNPDVLEIIRAKMSHVLGDFVTSATVMKALPSSYNLDFQEITPRLWESIDEVVCSLCIFSKLVAELEVNQNLADDPFLKFAASTELANILVRKYGVPFRIAHKVVGSLVKHMIDEGLDFTDATPELLRTVAKDSSNLSLNVEAEDVRTSVDPKKFVEAHKTTGGPSPAEVKRMMGIRKEWANASRAWLSEKKSKLEETADKLKHVVSDYATPDKNPQRLKAALNK